MGLQVYFLVMNIYGWYYWAKKPADDTKMPIVLIGRKELIWSIIAIIVFTVILGTGLKYTLSCKILILTLIVFAPLAAWWPRFGWREKYWRTG